MFRQILPVLSFCMALFTAALPLKAAFASGPIPSLPRCENLQCSPSAECIDFSMSFPTEKTPVRLCVPRAMTALGPCQIMQTGQASGHVWCGQPADMPRN